MALSSVHVCVCVFYISRPNHIRHRLQSYNITEEVVDALVASWHGHVVAPSLATSSLACSHAVWAYGVYKSGMSSLNGVVACDLLAPFACVLIPHSIPFCLELLEVLGSRSCHK